MNAIPIPRMLLPHTCKLLKSTKDRWGEADIEDIIGVSYVRFEDSTKMVYSKDNTALQLSAIMYYDCKNSFPRGLQFESGQTLERCGRVYTIQTIEAVYAVGNEPHHFELGLI